MRFDLLFYGSLMLASLGAAYWASLPVTSAQGTAILTIESKQVKTLAYNSAKINVTATKRDDDRYWIDFKKETMPLATPTPAPSPADPNAAAASPTPAVPEPTPIITTLRFLSSAQLNDNLKKLAPLIAERQIDDVKDEKDFGLDESAPTFAVSSESDPALLNLKVGKRSYGASTVFVKNLASNKVMLIDGAIIEDLEKADLRLMERRLVNFEASDVTTAEIALGTQTKRIQQKKPDPAGEASSQWSDVGDEAAPNQSYTTWMERIDRLRLMGYATDADLEKLKGVEPFMKVTFFKGDAPLDELTFKRVADPTGKQIYWAESRFLQTAAQITESRMTNLEKDADAILKGTAPVSEEAQPANPHGIAPANPHSAPPTDAAPPVSEGAPKE